MNLKRSLTAIDSGMLGPDGGSGSKGAVLHWFAMPLAQGVDEYKLEV